MKTTAPASSPVMMVPLADPCDVQTARRRTRRIRSVRPHPLPTDDDGPHLHATEAQRLLLVQEGRVVCVVERHRHDSALSVARLLCRLLLSEAFVYACPAGEADLLHPDQTVEHIPGTWQEVYRATPWAEPVIDEANSLPVVGIR